MEQQQQPAQILLEQDGILLCNCFNGNIQRIADGLLRIGCIQDQNVYFINIGDFYQTLGKQIPFIVFAYETQRTIIFPNVQSGYSALIIPTAYESNQELDTILKTTVTIYTKEQAREIPELKQSIDQHLPQIWNSPLLEESKIIHYIQKSGGILKNGFAMIGGVLAQGINYGGRWLGSKIDKNEKPGEVSTETKQKMEKIKSESKRYFDIGNKYAKMVLTPIAEYTNKTINDFSKRIDEGDNQTLKQAKYISKATGQSVGTAFQGLSSGAKDVGGAFSTQTKDLVHKKYGTEYVNVYLGGQTDASRQQYEAANQQEHIENLPQNNNNDNNQQGNKQSTAKGGYPEL